MCAAARAADPTIGATRARLPPSPLSRAQVGWTPLMEAAIQGQAGAVSWLLDQGADPSLKDNDGNTAADLAKSQGHDAVVRLLSEWCAAPRSPAPGTPRARAHAAMGRQPLEGGVGVWGAKGGGDGEAGCHGG